ncbi:MAG TPA: hypothetical protein VHB25_16500 [Gemmatimonadaceae bacterium]|nr:hypothetical protein [Gemmatimonadaceae bacterium]
MASGHREIERKYLLRALPPEAAQWASAEMEQGYLPGAQINERVRRIRESDGRVRYERTCKMGRGVERFEFQEETDEVFFTTVWPLTRGKRVFKRRYRVPAGALTFEVDEFLDRPLVLAEVELERADQRIDIPDSISAVLVREVTDEPEYSNHALAK